MVRVVRGSCVSPLTCSARLLLQAKTVRVVGVVGVVG